MAALLSPFVVLCLLCPGVVPASSSDYREFHITNTQFSDADFTTHILFPSTAVRSRLDCSRQCASHPHCQAFSYVHGSPHSCQGYSERKASGDPHEELPHASTFNVNRLTNREWKGTACVSDVDCVRRVTEIAKGNGLPLCYRHRCLCRHAWFYSVSRNICIRNCPKSQLQLSYTKYPRSAIADHNDHSFLGDLQACKRKCTESRDCESFEVNGYWCQAANDRGQIQDDDSWTLYLKDCA